MLVLCGLVEATGRSGYVLDRRADRSLFFARMHGFSRRAARKRAAELLDAVGLAGVRIGGEYVLARNAEATLVRSCTASPQSPSRLWMRAAHDLDPVAAD
jgi:hypothetical protein